MAQFGKFNTHTLVALVVLLWTPFTLAEEESDGLSFDGLKALEESRVYMAYIDPEADFSVFTSVAILDPHVAFRSNWQREQRRGRSRGRVSTSDMDRIKQDIGDMLKTEFTNRLESRGFDVVNYAGEDVLVLRPAIIDLDVSAPDTMSGGRSRTYTASVGAATLFIEMFDSLSGAIVGRAADRRSVRNGSGFATRANRVTNRAAASREFRVWADKLIDFLESHYIEAPDEAETP